MGDQAGSIANALVRGAAGFQRGRANRDANRQQVQDRQALQDQKLAESQSRIQGDADKSARVSLELETLRIENETNKIELQKTKGKVAQQALIRALNVAESNGEFSGVVDVLKNDEHFKKIYGPVAGMQPMNIGRDEALRLLEPARQEQLERERAGTGADVVNPNTPKDLAGNRAVGPPIENLEEMAQFWEDRPGLLKQTPKVIGTNGLVEAFDLREFKAKNLYYADKSDEDIQAEVTATNLKKSKIELGRLEQGLSAKPTPAESDIKTQARLTGETEAEVARKREVKRLAGIGSGQADEANLATTSVLDAFDSRGGFFNADFTNLEERVRAQPFIDKIEKNVGSIPKKTKERLQEMSKLLGLADTASKEGGLTPEGTGVFDRFVSKNLDRYVRDNIADQNKSEAEAGLLQFQQIMRQNISGSALTGLEASFDREASGRLSDKLPGLVAKFKTQVTQLKDELSAIANTNNPILSQFYLGIPTEKVDAIIGRLDKTLKSLSTGKSGGGNTARDRYIARQKAAKPVDFGDPSVVAEASKRVAAKRKGTKPNSIDDFFAKQRSGN